MIKAFDTKLRNNHGLKLILQYSLLITFFALLFFLINVQFPTGQGRERDWIFAFRPAALRFLSGKNPYDIAGFFNPPWALIFLTPYAILPPILGLSLLSATGFVAFFLVAKSFGNGNRFAILFLLNPFILLQNTLNPNIDWMVSLGFLMPPSIGLFFVLLKPQIGIAIAIYWLVQTWEKGGWLETVKIFGPVSISFLLSFILYGPYFFSTKILTENVYWNASGWPYLIPVGLSLIFIALRINSKMPAILASPCLSPYVPLHSWQVAIMSLIPFGEVPIVVAVATLWLAFLHWTVHLI